MAINANQLHVAKIYPATTPTFFVIGTKKSVASER